MIHIPRGLSRCSWNTWGKDENDKERIGYQVKIFRYIPKGSKQIY